MDESKFYEFILNKADSQIFIGNPENFELAFMNQAAADFWGKEKSTAKGEKCYSYIYGRECQCDHCPLKESQEEKRTQEFSFEGYRLRQSCQCFSWNGQTQFLIEITDITKQWTEEEKLLKQKERLQFFVNQAPCGFAVFCKNEEISLETYNATFVQLLGSEADYLEILKETLDLVFSERGKGQAVSKVTTDKRTIRWIYSCGKQVDQTFAYVYIFDVTAQRQERKKCCYSKKH